MSCDEPKPSVADLIRQGEKNFAFVGGYWWQFKKWCQRNNINPRARNIIHIDDMDTTHKLAGADYKRLVIVWFYTGKPANDELQDWGLMMQAMGAESRTECL